MQDVPPTGTRNPIPERGDDASDNATTILGPSHAIRWKWHVRDGVVAACLPADRFVGKGGAPVWSRALFDAAARAVAQGGRIGLIVSDFRFGNGVALQPDHESAPLFQDGYLGINAAAMTPEMDRTMLERGIAGVRAWQAAFGDKARFIFWDLFGRQVHDRLAGQYIGEGRYRHPVFNYADIVAQFQGANIADLSQLLRSPMHEVQRLFIDSSNHPSQIGYLLLNDMLCNGCHAVDAYQRAVTNVEAELFALARRIAEAKHGTVLLTGRSIWLDTLSSYMGQTGATRLAKEGLLLAPLTHKAGQPSIGQMLHEVSLDQCTPVVVSANGKDLAPQLAHAFGTDVAFWHDVPHIDWETATAPAITARGETPRHRYGGGAEPKAPHIVTLELAAHMVEQGPLGMPSWTGLRHGLERLAKPSAKRAAAHANQVVHDVLLTQDKIAFLIGGNHAVLKFATGELVPSQASLNAFSANIASRHQLTAKRQASYLHVIFPDKQSVMIEAFPFQPVHRLGDLYLAHMPPSERDHVLYPADALRQQTSPSFLPMDTHMTDHGSLAVVQMMLSAVQIVADEALSQIHDRIIKPQRWMGDLGSKFTPPLFQQGLVLSPNWPIRQFRSPGQFNDGMIDILLSPDAPIRRTALLFGDSFFRMMLPHLSAVFSRVVCLRSRFMHAEMLDLIRPDHIFTGSAERYLSDVAPDTEANAFMLYPHLRGTTDLTMDKDFLAAWDAVTSPTSRKAEAYFTAQGVPRRVPLA